MPNKKEIEEQRSAHLAELRRQRELDKKVARGTALVGTGVGVLGVGAALKTGKAAKAGAREAEASLKRFKQHGIGVLAGEPHGYSWGNKLKGKLGKLLPFVRTRKLKMSAKGESVLNKMADTLNLGEDIANKSIAKQLAGLITFEEGGSYSIREARQVQRQMKKFIGKGRQGYSAAQDIEDKIKGQRRNPRRKFFWEKQGFKDAALATALTAGVGGAGLLAHKKGWLSKVSRGSKGSSPATVPTKFDPNFNPELSSKGDTIEFYENYSDIPEGWRTSRPTAKSVRVHRDGGKRSRRSKYWHERKESRDKILVGLTGLAAVAGGGALIARGKYKKAKAALGKSNADRARTKGAARRILGRRKKEIDALKRENKRYKEGDDLIKARELIESLNDKRLGS